MTDTQWGPPLTGEQMKLLRDAGLPDGTRVFFCGHEWSVEMLTLTDDDYQLLSNHPAYTLIVKGWLNRPNVRLHFGSDKAPEDWCKGNTILLANGQTIKTELATSFYWGRNSAECEPNAFIIAYIAKVDVTETPVDDHQNGLMSLNDHQDTVTIAKMTEAEASARLQKFHPLGQVAAFEALKELGLITTRAERFWQGKERHSLYRDESARALIDAALEFER